MNQVSIVEAKAQLSKLINAALRGDEVIIARRNVPLVKLVVVESAKVGPRFGKLRGQVSLSSDFDAPIEDFAEYS